MISDEDFYGGRTGPLEKFYLFIFFFNLKKNFFLIFFKIIFLKINFSLIFN